MSIELIISKVTEKIANRQFLAIFDRDGTLVPINPDPEAAVLSENVLARLLKLNSLANTRVAILSARDMQQLNNDFKGKNLILCGNYGMELVIPDQAEWIEPSATKSRSLLLEVKSKLEQQFGQETQVVLEDHKLTLCLHWHLTPIEIREKVHAYIRALKKKYKKLLFQTLPTSYEVWPDLQWDKANGLAQLTSMLEVNADNCLILYIGDSDSDEPAFSWVNNRHGITVRVGYNAKSLAQFTVDSPKAVETILAFLIDELQKN